MKVRLTQCGYGKDPIKVAHYAIKKAALENDDVILIDTAGRMQNNRELMETLAKLLISTKSDLILFVCEALVGNEAVNQLLKFNKSLEQQSEKALFPCTIDGIVLTKFDTIDDKV